MPDALPIVAGQRVSHVELGEGVVVEAANDGYARVFFPSGERRVNAATLTPARSLIERVIENVAGGTTRLRDARLRIEAYALPLLENAAALTSARIDLLPHQVVLTHRVATATPRRFLVADEVGLGKTIETALILRELASRGELNRALMIVPAGLVNNWHRELNEVFNLNFEVFGSEGDVTDRKSNAFAKHDRLIASVDTLKRPARIKRLLDAPRWDLIVFDEAHHLSAYRNGSKVRKTENYKLAEVMRDHARDLLLLSATPHQGDHFRFWMLVQLLNPTLFAGPEEMVDERHRLNTVVFRRTKADACAPDGSPLFARRWVHSESFTMSPAENAFYGKLREYLQDGFDLAKKQGNQGRALGFVMTIFQKIAASSFAAVRGTLRRRQLMLTIHEAVLKDKALDIDARDTLLDEARGQIRSEANLPDDAIGRGEVDRILADLKLHLLKKLDEDDLHGAADANEGEVAAAGGEDLAATAVALSLPEERLRIGEVLAAFPADRETKVAKLLRGLGAFWEQNPAEKVVIFATYLGTVELLSREIEAAYPGQGVVVLRGGDHGSKLAAERRFRRKDGPRVLVCTAAGREGINLQFARVLFNFDLPWNPMDVEQRIGRIHRYGQNHTAQVYNLILSDTIEGKIYLLLTDKLTEIAKTLGKVDESGNVTEDFKGQILGQLSDRLSYEQLYRNALSDPELKRTRQELEAAVANATEARQVVTELFQDLDRFTLDDYAPLANVDEGKQRILAFLREAVEADGGTMRTLEGDRFSIEHDGTETRATLNRDLAQADDSLQLMGLDHELMSSLLSRWQRNAPEAAGVVAQADVERPAVLTLWLARAFQNGVEARTHLVPVAVDEAGNRLPAVEKRYAEHLTMVGGKPHLNPDRRLALAKQLEGMLSREFEHRGLTQGNAAHSAELVAWVELMPTTRPSTT